MSLPKLVYRNLYSQVIRRVLREKDGMYARNWGIFVGHVRVSFAGIIVADDANYQERKY